MQKMKIAKKIALGLLLVFVVMQFIRPEKNVSSDDHLAQFILETNPSEDVRAILKGSCYDCHSNHTVYPWYNSIAPVSYWMADHIRHGKGELNFSDWDAYGPRKKIRKLEEVAKTVKSGEMPLEEYTWTHSEAKLSKEQRQAIVAWAERTRVLYTLGDRPD